ncbi:hypothetical protein B0A55_08647 [Friedmanniomyces simplex]|uniref:Uncharacterized protein n=1 Tax=Friedmanniomyces simplex TaxID=329884 RepID=A0A4U0WVG8_9PEZI|nr:hypothetical protein B0A55_08647 [Friedmanniomyces simplex]
MPMIRGTSRREDGRVIVTLDQHRPHHVSCSGESLAVSIINKLLQKCVHAYFLITVCEADGNIEGSAPFCGEEWRRDLGIDGHGAAWQCLAEAVEWVGSTVLGIPVILGRETLYWWTTWGRRM